MRHSLIGVFALGLLLAQGQPLPAPPPGDPANYILVRRPDGSFVYVPLDKHGHPAQLPGTAPAPAAPGTPPLEEGGYQVVPPARERPPETPRGGGHFVVPKP